MPTILWTGTDGVGGTGGAKAKRSPQTLPTAPCLGCPTAADLEPPQWGHLPSTVPPLLPGLCSPCPAFSLQTTPETPGSSHITGEWYICWHNIPKAQWPLRFNPPHVKGRPRGTRAGHCSQLPPQGGSEKRRTGLPGAAEGSPQCGSTVPLSFPDCVCQTWLINGYKTRPSCCFLGGAGRQLWSLLCVPAAKASCSRHANLQAQSQGTVKSLLLAVLAEVHFTQDLPFDSARRVTFSTYSLHLHRSPRETGVNSCRQPQPSEILTQPHTLVWAYSGVLVCASLHGCTECHRMGQQQQQKRN